MTPPIGLAYLASSLLAKNHQVQLIDALGQDPDYIELKGHYLYQGLPVDKIINQIDPSSALIGISCMFSQEWPYVRSVIQKFRNAFPNCILIAGGEHVTALPEFSLQDCPQIDFVVKGEGEETLVELAGGIEQGKSLDSIAGVVYRKEGKIFHGPPRSRIKNVDDIPLPAWHLIQMEPYLKSRNAHGVFLGRSMPILATRGCPYECTFCSNALMYGRSWFPRSPAKVLDEIETYMKVYQASNFDFYDLTIIIQKDWIMRFCQGIEERNLHFTWQLPSGTRAEVIDEEVAEALYRTGCRNMTYAPESGSNETLKKIKKRVNLTRLTSSIKSALGKGMHVKCNLIIGFPHETPKNIISTIMFSWKLAVLGVHDAPMYLFSPYPGTELFEELKDIHYKDGLDDSYFESLHSYMDLKRKSRYCRAISPSMLNFWRLFGISSFYGIQMLVRPWRLVRLLANLVKNTSQTVLEQRLGALVYRKRTNKI